MLPPPLNALAEPLRLLPLLVPDLRVGGRAMASGSTPDLLEHFRNNGQAPAPNEFLKMDLRQEANAARTATEQTSEKEGKWEKGGLWISIRCYVHEY